jgi:hypothetical protein
LEVLVLSFPKRLGPTERSYRGLFEPWLPVRDSIQPGTELSFNQTDPIGCPVHTYFPIKHFAVEHTTLS